MNAAEPARADNKAKSSILSAESLRNESFKAHEAGQFGADHAAQEPASVSDELPGERGESGLHRARSLQSRASQVLALSLMGALAVGLLGWYYVHTFASRGTAQRTAQTASRNQAAGDAPLPSLGPITLPEIPVEKVLGPAPEKPPINHETNLGFASAASPVGASSPASTEVTGRDRLGSAVVGTGVLSQKRQ